MVRDHRCVLRRESLNRLTAQLGVGLRCTIVIICISGCHCNRVANPITHTSTETLVLQPSLPFPFADATSSTSSLIPATTSVPLSSTTLELPLA